MPWSLAANIFLTSVCSRNVQISLVVLLMGVGIATVTDLQLNVLGSVLSLLAIVTTCVAQIVSSAILLQFYYYESSWQFWDERPRYSLVTKRISATWFFSVLNLVYWFLSNFSFLSLCIYFEILTWYTIRWQIPSRRSSRFLQPNFCINLVPIRQSLFLLPVHLWMGFWRSRTYLLSTILLKCWWVLELFPAVGR